MADMAFVRIVEPADEPITLQQAREQCRVDDDLEDALISDLIVTARDYCERVTGLPLMPQTMVLYCDRFCGEMVLKPNLIDVEKIEYIDHDGVLQALEPADYTIDKHSVVGSVYPSYGRGWPPVRCQKNAVQITFTCGFANRSKVPETIKSAMKLLIEHWWQNRGAVIIGTITSQLPVGVDQMLGMNKIWRI